MRWLRRLMCRHMDMAIEFSTDGTAPGWSWHCYSCGKSRSLA